MLYLLFSGADLDPHFKMADIVPSAENKWLFSDEDLLGYRAQFDAFDEDGGGTIENDELKGVLRGCGMSVTDKQVDDMIKEFDSDGNGVLDFDEFLAMMFRLQSEPSETEMKKAIFEVRRFCFETGLLTAAQIEE